MVRQAHTALAALGTKTDSYGAGDADLTMQAADAANFEEVAHTGKILVIAHNTDGADPYTVTIESVVDKQGRTGDVTTYSLAADDYAVFGPFTLEGWRQTGGELYFKASNAAIKLGVVAL